MTAHVIVGRKKPLEAAAVAEHPELRLGFTIGGRQHKQQNAEVLLHVTRAEAARLLQYHGSPARRQIDLLPVRMVAVLQRLEGLVVDLRRRHDPQH